MSKKGDVTERLSRYYTRSEGSVPTYGGRDSSSGAGSVSLPSIRTGTRQSMRSNRSNMGSRLMLPGEFATPGPDAYNIKSTIGGNKGGPLFKGDRSRPFEQIKSSNATFLLPRLTNATPAPGDYNIKSSIGKGLKSTFGTARRDSRFAGDRTNNAIFLLQKYDDPSPAPTRYSYKQPASSTTSGMSAADISRGSTFTRSKRDARFSGENNAKFLLPRIIQKNPGPTAYKTENFYSFGKNARGAPFPRARRNARFAGDHKAVFLLTERLDKFRRPNSYSSYNLNS